MQKVFGAAVFFVAALLTTNLSLMVLSSAAHASAESGPASPGDGATDNELQNKPNKLRRKNNINNKAKRRNSRKKARTRTKKRNAKPSGSRKTQASTKPKTLKEKIRLAEKRVKEIREKSKISKRAQEWKKKMLEEESLRNQIEEGEYRKKVYKEAKAKMGGSENFCCTKGKAVLQEATAKWLDPELPHMKEIMKKHEEQKAAIADEAIRATNPEAYDSLTKAKQVLAELNAQLEKTAEGDKKEASKTPPPQGAVQP